MKGGFDAWQGFASRAEVDQGIYLIEGHESPEELLSLAYGLEDGNSRFYDKLSQQSDDKETSQIFRDLAEFENKHKESIWQRYKALSRNNIGKDVFESRIVKGVLEGGKTSDEILDEYSPWINEPAEAMDLAMSLEMDALDGYLRMAHKVQDEKAKKLFYRLSEEERVHLQKLSELFRSKVKGTRLKVKRTKSKVYCWDAFFACI